MQIIDKLCYGGVHPGERTHPSAAYTAAMAKLSDDEDRLVSQLDDVAQMAFERYCDSQKAVMALSDLDFFASGVRFGVKLMMDVLGDAS